MGKYDEMLLIVIYENYQHHHNINIKNQTGMKEYVDSRNVPILHIKI